MKLLEIEKSNNFTEVDVMEELGCLAALSDLETKKSIWKNYVKGNTFNVKGLDASAKYFYNLNDKSMCDYFAD